MRRCEKCLRHCRKLTSFDVGWQFHRSPEFTTDVSPLPVRATGAGRRLPRPLLPVHRPADLGGRPPSAASAAAEASWPPPSRAGTEKEAGGEKTEGVMNDEIGTNQVWTDTGSGKFH